MCCWPNTNAFLCSNSRDLSFILACHKHTYFDSWLSHFVHLHTLRGSCYKTTGLIKVGRQSRAVFMHKRSCWACVHVQLEQALFTAFKLARGRNTSSDKDIGKEDSRFMNQRFKCLRTPPKVSSIHEQEFCLWWGAPGIHWGPPFEVPVKTSCWGCQYFVRVYSMVVGSCRHMQL